MKYFLSVLAAVLVGSVTAHATLFSSTDTPKVIPDGNISGIESTINVSGLDPTVSSLTLNLNISGGRNGDLYAYLTHDNATAILLNRVGRGEVAGGYDNNGFNVTIADGSPDIHTYQLGGVNLTGPLTGTWGPDGRDVSPFVSTTSSSRTSFLSNFTGGNANGSWTLFIADVNGNTSESTLDSWSLDITAVPEPVDYALMAFGGIFAAVQGVRYMKKRKVVA